MSSPSTFQPTSPDAVFRMEPFGEAAVIVLLGGGINEASYRQLSALARAIQENPPRGLTELVPAYNSLLVVFNPLLSDIAGVSAAVQALAASLSAVYAEADKDIIDLPVAYGGNYGPDLESVAANAGLTMEEVIDIHSSKPYLVYMLGFTPGFPYLGGMDPRIATPRLKTPRTKVPAGSVGIADAQTGVYPLESPGGWNLIGRTPLTLFDPDRQNPALLAPGKYVRFVPIKHDSFDALHSHVDSRSGDDQKPDRGLAKAPDADSAGLSARTITVLKPGALSTVQDAGRYGYQAAGVPPSGPMDEYSMNLANMLAGNEPGTACIECTLGGLELRFGSDASFALAGADTIASLCDRTVAMHTTLRAKAGDVLRLGMARIGLRIYLAVDGGIAVPRIMGSRSTFQRGGFGGLNGRALSAGDSLPLGKAPGVPVPQRTASHALIPGFPSSLTVRAIPSHEADRFTANGLERFFSASYSVSQKSDRMGCRLEGPVIEHSAGADIISSGVQTGTVQVPGDGQPIVLMSDRQTTGGYTRIAQVIRADLPLLGQARPGDTVHFVRTTPAEAATALAAKHELLQQLLAGQNSSPGRRTDKTRNFQVSIDGHSFTVTLEEISQENS